MSNIQLLKNLKAAIKSSGTSRLLRCRARTRPYRRLCLEPLESRALPTVVFQPLHGVETVADHGGSLLSDPSVYLIFWGSYWTNNPKPTRDQIELATLDFLGGPYLGGLSQYSAAMGKAHYAGAVVDTIDPEPFNGFSYFNLQSIVNSAINSLGLPDPNASATEPVYMVITPPGINSDMADAAGYHTVGVSNSLRRIFFGWIGNDGTVDQVTRVLSHEVVETISDPWATDILGVGGITVTPGVTYSGIPGDELADNEAQDHVARLNETLVQSYWSARHNAYIVPDGNRQNFTITQYGQLLVYGDQLGLNFNDSMTIDLDSSGHVLINLNGEKAAFSSRDFSTIIVETGGGDDVVNVERSGVPVNVFLGNGADRVNLAPVGKNLGVFGRDISVFGGDGAGSLNIFDQNNPDDYDSYSLTDTTVKRTGTVEINYHDLASVAVSGGSGFGHFYDIDSTSAGSTVIDAGSGSGYAYVSPTARNLYAIRGSLTVLGGHIGLIVEDDQNSSEVLTQNFITGTSFTHLGLTIDPFSGPKYLSRTINYDGLGSLIINTGSPLNLVHVESTSIPTIVNAGVGTALIDVSPQDENLDNIKGSLSLRGNGVAALVVNDQQNPNFQLTQDFMTRGGLTRIGLTIDPATGQPKANVATIDYSGMASFTFNAGPLVNLIHLEGAMATTTINAGVGTALIDVSAQNKDLSNILGAVTINGTGSQPVIINDQNDQALDVYTIADSFVTRPGSGAVSYSNISGLTINGSNVGSIFRVLSKPSAPEVVINGGFNFNILAGPDESETWSLAGSNSGMLGDSITFAKIQNLVGGAADDTFVLHDGATLSGAIDGGAGFDTLDYRAYGSSAFANLVTGQATGIGAGIKNIELVLGASLTLAVINVMDEGPGSLRQAILDANTNPGPDVIAFNIPGEGVQSIAVGSATGQPLPEITDPVVIDGYSQPGASANTLPIGGDAVILIALDGSCLGVGFNGLHITAGYSTIQGLMIGNFRYSAAPDYIGGYGILLESGGNTIQGNYIGNNGVTSFANSFGVGTGALASDNLIGGTTPASRNIISGNSDGIYGAGSGSRIQGNYIGLNAAGDAALPNREDGINLAGAVSSLVGGTLPGAGNVISGNVRFGLAIGGVNIGPDNGSVVQGNLIGTNATGMSAIGNEWGVVIGQSDHHLIGGTTPAARNVISGNTYTGIEVSGIYAHDNFFQGNYVGTNVLGTAALSNAAYGMLFEVGASHNTIGGLTANAGNLISGNGADGINFHGATDNVVLGNLIGTGVDGIVPLGNGRNGVLIGLSGDATPNNTIGGSSPGEGNTIAFNGGDGVSVMDVGSTGNTIRGNSIHDNAELGIDLSNDGITPNDVGDLDSGPNDLLNFPRLSLVQHGESTRVVGKLSGSPGATFTLDFYANAGRDPSGFGQGDCYLGSAMVTTNANGQTSFDFILPEATHANDVITATATDSSGNTSEFSGNRNPVAIAGGPYVTSEGNGLTLDALASSDPDFDPLAYTWDVNGDGVFGDATGVNPTLTWDDLKALNIRDGAASFDVRVRADDGFGGVSKSPPVLLTINNTAPTASSAGPGDGVRGQPRTFTFGAIDASPIDQIAGFTYSISWGDGTADQLINRIPGNGTGVSLDHIYTANGTYIVRMTAMDKDDAVSGAVTRSITIQAVKLQSGGILAVGGTLAADTISLTPVNSSDSINVLINGVSQGSFLPNRIQVFGQAGDDVITLLSKKIGPTTYSIAVPAYLYGGDGKDSIDASGSRANNVLFGDANDDVMTGGIGRDLLIGGSGADKLHGNGGDNILIGATTDYDVSNAAKTYTDKLSTLDAIMAEWTGINSYGTRVSNLLSLLNSTTVHDDGVSDMLFGDPMPDLDWFFAKLGQDVLKNARDGELVTTI